VARRCRPTVAVFRRQRALGRALTHGLDRDQCRAGGLCACPRVTAIILDRRPYSPGKPNYIPLMIIALANHFGARSTPFGQGDHLPLRGTEMPSQEKRQQETVTETTRLIPETAAYLARD
jgi:hypothetical protein